MDDELIDARFLICSDLFLFNRFTPAELACDLPVVIANFAYGAEKVALRLLGKALESGVAETALLVNAFQPPSGRRQPLALKVEEVLDATSAAKPVSSSPPKGSRRFVSTIRIPRRSFSLSLKSETASFSVRATSLSTARPVAALKSCSISSGPAVR